MKYVILSSESYGGLYTLGIFSTRRQALAFVAQHTPVGVKRTVKLAMLKQETKAETVEGSMQLYGWTRGL